MNAPMFEPSADLQPESLARVVAVPAPRARVEILELVR